MRYSVIKKTDIADGEGIRVSLFVSGCRNHCPGCFQPETWSFCYGQDYTKETEDEIMEALKPSYVNGLTLLGGDPFEPENQEALISLVQRVKREMPEKTIWAYSGYTLDKLMGKEPSHARCQYTDEILDTLDVLVDGRFVLEKKDISLKFRGSSNQRLIDMEKTRASGSVVLWDN